MNSDFRKLFKIDSRFVTEGEACGNGIYSIYFLSDDDQVDRIEMFSKGNVFKVVYPDRDRPFDKVLEKHFNVYPNLGLEIWERRILDKNNINRYRAHLYRSSGEKFLIKECFVDSDDLLVREEELDDDLMVCCAFDYLYENGKLVKIIELDSDGNKVSQQDLD